MFRKIPKSTIILVKHSVFFLNLTIVKPMTPAYQTLNFLSIPFQCQEQWAWNWVCSISLHLLKTILPTFRGETPLDILHHWKARSVLGFLSQRQWSSVHKKVEKYAVAVNIICTLQGFLCISIFRPPFCQVILHFIVLRSFTSAIFQRLVRLGYSITCDLVHKISDSINNIKKKSLRHFVKLPYLYILDM